MLGTATDTLNERVQPIADKIGEALKVEKYCQTLFTEEILRGSLLHSLSMCINKIEHAVLKKAQLGDWLVISRGRASGSHGTVLKVNELSQVVNE